MSDKKGSTKNPTSPHLEIYKWNISSLTSIMHRATGVLLYASIVAIIWYIIYYTYQINPTESADQCDCPMKKIIDNIFILAAVGVTFSLFYHFCNGVRHLFWDIGYGFDIKVAKKTGYIVVLTSLLLTAITIGSVIYLKIF